VIFAPFGAGQKLPERNSGDFDLYQQLLSAVFQPKTVSGRGIRRRFRERLGPGPLLLNSGTLSLWERAG
jgi:hypothetical protein